MPVSVQVGDTVFVPRASLGQDPGQYASALARGTVVALPPYNATLHVAGSQHTVSRASLRTNVGVLVLRIGDFTSEYSLLDPLAKSVLHFLRLLLPDDCVLLLEVRTLDELAAWWAINHGGYGNVVVIAHGDTDELVFGVGGGVSSSAFVQRLNVSGVTSKIWLSLACRTGYGRFAKAFSCSPVCSDFIAPFHSVHGALGSLFAQTFFVRHLHEGEGTAIAFRHAKQNIPQVSFRRWKDGKMHV